jgi:hypothetical protein
MRWAALAWVLAAMPAVGAYTLASRPTDLSVTVYRAPDRGSGSIKLDQLEGFALISETRAVHLPAGLTRLRFEGVADGIEPASAIVTGLPAGVIEKNREGLLLSPSALAAAAVGKRVMLLRTHPKTGKVQRLDGQLLSDAGGGVVFESPDGIEALRCSGLPETFSFSGVTDLAATPTLSVLVNSPQAITVPVTLSYLAQGFDWAADYTATLSTDEKTMDLGAWVTLANGNGVGFPSARTQVVAGRVNRETGDTEPLDAGSPIFAQCWPRGSTSDIAGSFLYVGASGGRMDRMFKRAMMSPAPMAAALQQVTVTAQRNVQQEQLGDLKLYRVPDRTTVASRQSKQVRLMDRSGIPVARIYGAELSADIAGADPAGENPASVPAYLLLRTTNSQANHLGLPLPSGRIAVYAARGGAHLLLHESGLRDLAVDEEVEFNLGDTADVRVAAAKDSTTHEAAQVDDANRVVISNARPTAIRFELRLTLREGERVVGADHPVGTKNGRPIFRLTIPANAMVTLRYHLHEPAVGLRR